MLSESWNGEWGKDKSEKYFRNNSLKCPKFGKRPKTTESGSYMKSKQDKLKKMHTKTHNQNLQN